MTRGPPSLYSLALLRSIKIKSAKALEVLPPMLLNDVLALQKAPGIYRADGNIQIGIQKEETVKGIRLKDFRDYFLHTPDVKFFDTQDIMEIKGNYINNGYENIASGGVFGRRNGYGNIASGGVFRIMTEIVGSNISPDGFETRGNIFMHTYKFMENALELKIVCYSKHHGYIGCYDIKLTKM